MGGGFGLLAREAVPFYFFSYACGIGSFGDAVISHRQFFSLASGNVLRGGFVLVIIYSGVSHGDHASKLTTF